MGLQMPDYTACNTAHHATTAMHPAQSWRDGWNDAVDGNPFGTTQDGYSMGDNVSRGYYADGYSNGSIRRRAFVWVRND